MEYIGTEGQTGRPMSHVASIAVNVWGCDLFQHWYTQINIPVVSKTEHKPTNVSGKYIIQHYKKWSPPIKAVQKDKTARKP